MIGMKNPGGGASPPSREAGELAGVLAEVRTMTPARLKEIAAATFYCPISTNRSFKSFQICISVRILCNSNWCDFSLDN